MAGSRKHVMTTDPWVWLSPPLALFGVLIVLRAARLFFKDKPIADARCRYGQLWAWFFTVSYAAVLVHVAFIHGLVTELLSQVEASRSLLELLDEATADTVLGYTLSALIGVLFWWRAVKVVVFHACPVAVGTEVMQTYQTTSGRFVQPYSVMHAEGNTGWLYFLVVLRAHPASDKLARARLDRLMFALTPNLVLTIGDSQWALLKYDHPTRMSALDDWIVGRYDVTAGLKARRERSDQRARDRNLRNQKRSDELRTRASRTSSEP